MAPPSPHRCVERILVIHTAFLGDIILSTPFLRALRSRFPEAEIRFLTTPGGAALLNPNPWNVLPLHFDKRGSDSGMTGLWRKGRELRRFRPDLVYCLHRSLRSALLARLAGGECWGFEEGAASFLFHGTASRSGFSYEAEKNLALLRAREGGEGSPAFPELKASAENEGEANGHLEGAGRFVALAPSSVWATKRWPARRFGELAARIRSELGLGIVVVGSSAPEDLEAARGLVEAFRELMPGEPILNLAGCTSLGGLKSVLSRAELVISNDSSPLHMAVAMGAKALGVFGPTTKELGFFPLAPEGRSAVAEVSGLACRPCGLHGHRKCPEGHFRCMLDLDAGRVYVEVKRLLCP